MVLENQKLIKENKMILEAFPHAVLIENSSSSYSNLEFAKKFRDPGDAISNFKQFPVSIRKEYDEREHELGHKEMDSQHLRTLRQCLERQVARLEHDDVIEQHSVFIKNWKMGRVLHEKDKNYDASDHDDSKSEVIGDNEVDEDVFKKGRYYNIKSMKVHWNRQPSIMHVFIDTTYILKLEEANNNIKCQKIMFTSVSHEFRTPLNSILNAWDILKESCGQMIKVIGVTKLAHEHKEIFDIHSKIIQKFIRIGKHSSELLLALVEDVLNLSKMESNMFTLNITEFDIEELVLEVVDMFEFQWKGKRLELILDVDKGLNGALLWSDRGRIKQTLINLIANALKFTYNGSISIRVCPTRIGDQRAAKFDVRDTGIGISEEDQNKLFKLFGMLKDKNKINPNGCGIGLTVSKRYVEMLKGEFEMKSNLGEGTTMSFTIPNVIDKKWKIIEEVKEYSQR
jgi:signal transduction histidine kinase